jgi:hypothetical protein
MPNQPKPNDLLRLEDAARLGFPAHPHEGKRRTGGLRSSASLARTSLSLKSTDGGTMPYPGKGVGLYFQRAGRDRTSKIIERGVWCIRDGASNDAFGFGEGALDDAPELKGAPADYITTKRKIPRDSDRHPARSRSRM